MKFVYVTLMLLALAGCDKHEEVAAIQSSLGIEKVWVFAQFNVVEEKGGLDSYYYYGKISKNTFKAISENRLTKGFILLEEVKYWTNEDVIKEYKDVENSGQLLFRIQDIQKLNLINVEPVAGKGIEQFEEKPKQALAGAAGGGVGESQHISTSVENNETPEARPD